MPLTIHCYEPQSLPRQASLVLETAQPFAVYALQDTLAEDARELRTTVLRRASEHPPPQSVLLFEVEVKAGRAGELPILRVLKVGGRAMIEVLRLESRGRVVKGNEFKSGARFEATLLDLRTVTFSIEIQSDLVGGRAGIGSSRPPGSKALESFGSLVWIVPTVAETLAEPTGKIIAFIALRLKKLGFTPAMLSPMLLMSGFMLGAVWFAYDQYKGVLSAEERLKALEEAIANAQIARDEAIHAETECREQRKDLAQKLDDIEESRKLQAEIALSKPLAHAVAIEGGGSRMAAEDVLKFDDPAWKNMHKLVVSQMASVKEARNLAPVCLAQEERLGQDLPKFVLTWHPSKDLLCPEDFGGVIDGVDVAGPWGLSSRVAREFGSVAEGEGDPRKNERWAAAAMTTGLRAVMGTLLSADTGDRPPVPPGELHVWTLALFDAYNRMPSPAGGSMDRRVEECVADMVVEVARRYQPAEPGQSVLPPIDGVAGGEELKITPTSGCPWSPTAINQGAAAALRAVTDMALIQWAIDEAEGGAAGGEDAG
jgi:hypothetical protein